MLEIVRGGEKLGPSHVYFDGIFSFCWNAGEVIFMFVLGVSGIKVFV